MDWIPGTRCLTSFTSLRQQIEGENRANGLETSDLFGQEPEAERGNLRPSSLKHRHVPEFNFNNSSSNIYIKNLSCSQVNVFIKLGL